MNDIALSGLAKQLVQAELLTEKGAQQAWQQAQRNRLSLVSYLVQNKLVKSSQVAEIASEHFGMALLDLNCLDKETQPKGLVSEKLVRQHHVLQDAHHQVEPGRGPQRARDDEEQRARALGIEMPISEAVVALLEGQLQPAQAVAALMGRDPKDEAL